jgi:D-lyxose ketol-isomerase
MHRHIVKAEDIINRGGATLALKLYNSDAEGAIDKTTDVVVATDGVLRRQGPGEVLRVNPGESVTLLPGNWHAFWGEGGDVLIGEVSTVNNDLTDNIFAEPLGRFAEIEENVDPMHLLVSDYPNWLA